MANVMKTSIIVGIDKNNDTKSYRVMLVQVNQKAEKQYDWNFQCKMVTEPQMINYLTTGNKCLNAGLSKDGRSIKGTCGSFDRFDNRVNRPYVILSQIQSTDGKTLGYKIANYDGGVKNISIKEMLAYGNRISKAGGVPVQNAIFVGADEDKKAHYKSYPDYNFLIEVLPTKENKHTEVKKVNVTENKKTLNKLDEIYSKEQIEQLKIGKSNGVDIRIYANPALSAEQMEILRKGLERKLNVRPLAFPYFKPNPMRYYIEELACGSDIRKYLNKDYDIHQISELSIAVEQGLDISKMANPKLKADEMAEIRERLERKIWKDEFVKKDGSWK